MLYAYWHTRNKRLGRRGHKPQQPFCIIAARSFSHVFVVFVCSDTYGTRSHCHSRIFAKCGIFFSFRSCITFSFSSLIEFVCMSVCSHNIYKTNFTYFKGTFFRRISTSKLIFFLFFVVSEARNRRRRPHWVAKGENNCEFLLKRMLMRRFLPKYMYTLCIYLSR